MFLELFAWFAQAALLDRIVKTATGKVCCNVCKTIGQLGLVTKNVRNARRIT